MPGTSLKIEQFQKILQEGGSQQPIHTQPADSVLQQGSESPAALQSNGIPIEVYERFLQIFRQRLYSVWPIVSYDDLVGRLRNNRDDYESYSLAAALCSAVIAQLRLPEHVDSLDYSVSSFELAAESQRLRRLFDYQEHLAMASLLTSFFLHIYFANAEKLRTAGFFLRESLTYAHGLKLHQTKSYAGLSYRDKQLRLRVYWILFVSERTYCIQNDLPITLRPINDLPDASPKDGYDSAPMPAFVNLIRLFTFLDGDILSCTASLSDAALQIRAKAKVSHLQHNLVQQDAGENLDESQSVDLLTTRNWIRILLWQYTIAHFSVSCRAQDQAFSALLPATIARDMLLVLDKVSWKSVQPHGYGMELKIFRMADSLLDVLLCAPASVGHHKLLRDSRESLHCLEKVLLHVGGAESQFLAILRKRMLESQLPPQQTMWNDMKISSPQCQGEEEEARSPS
ncbi:aflYd/ sugR/ sugar regulator [Cladophialophora carrionii]|uniref:AflYd/ sugR/ sugar regulator n=1 Tax=Cladophialophora carrionii TaxID=86049 RepID=A0A1C1CAA1_9EURO|nr:aflYd/ sugR/ sugar regulator [Cladophialophora carrionii]